MADMQEKYMEYQVLEKQGEKLQKELQKISEQLYEIEYIKNSLDEYSESKEGDELLSPISSGIFVKSSISKDRNFYVNVGSGVVVKKNLEEAKALLEEQVHEMASVQAKIAQNIDAINERISAIESEIVNKDA